jgi:hypothetical protein
MSIQLFPDLYFRILPSQGAVSVPQADRVLCRAKDGGRNRAEWAHQRPPMGTEMRVRPGRSTAAYLMAV